MEVQMSTGQVGGLHHIWGALSLGTWILYDRCKQLALCHGGKHSLYYTGQKANKPFAQEGITISIFQDCLLYKLLEKIVQNKTAIGDTPQDIQKCKSPIENCLSNRGWGWAYGIKEGLSEFIECLRWDLSAYQYRCRVVFRWMALWPENMNLKEVIVITKLKGKFSVSLPLGQ